MVCPAPNPTPTTLKAVVGLSFIVHVHRMRCHRDRAGHNQPPSSGDTRCYRHSPLRSIRRWQDSTRLFGSKCRGSGVSVRTEK